MTCQESLDLRAATMLEINGSREALTVPQGWDRVPD